MSDSRITACWRALRAANRRALIPYVTVGFPTVAESCDVLQAIDATADIIEVGVPFSDPLADGPTIQASTFRALQNGMTLGGTLELVARAKLTSPIVLFSYVNPVLQYGVDRLLADAAASGVAGLLLTDVPVGADPTVEAAIEQSPLDLIRLLAPTTSNARLERTAARAQGFIYLIARLGVTGASTQLAGDLDASVARVRGVTSLPVAVGFGVSTPSQAAAVADVADGVVVGSALIDVLGRAGVGPAAAFLGTLRDAIDQR